MDLLFNLFWIGEGLVVCVVILCDVVDIGNLGYWFGLGLFDEYVNFDILILLFLDGLVVYVSGINCGWIVGLFVIVVYVESDGEKWLIGFEVVFSCWYVVGCVNC